MHRSCFAVLLGMVCATVASAQEIDTDRPDQTESSAVLPVDHVQIETGVTYEERDVADVRALSIGSTLVRVGLLDGFELRFTGEYLREESELPGGVVDPNPNGGETGSVNSGMAGISAGVKIAISEDEGLLPEIAFIAHLVLPVGGDLFAPDRVVPEMRLSVGHTLAEGVSFGYNLGGEWDEAGGAAGIYTAALGLDIAPGFGGYVELFGVLPAGEPAEHLFDCGVTFLPMENLQFDLSGGLGLTEHSPDFYIGAGASLRVPD